MAEEIESEVLLQTGAAYPAPQYIVDEAYISQKEYERLYKHSLENPEAFWEKAAEKELEWFKKWDKVFEWDYPNYKWFSGAKLHIIALTGMSVVECGIKWLLFMPMKTATSRRLLMGNCWRGFAASPMD